jgi:uncharacterized protein
MHARLKPIGHRFSYRVMSLLIDLDRLAAADRQSPEVCNTFGERHTYALAVKPGEISDAGLRQSQEKLFYVSPFIEMAMRYHFRVVPPADSIRLRILETDRDGPLLAATFNGRRRALSTAELLRSVFALPLVTLKIVAAIHWDALRLWLKGARLVPRQNAASNSGLAIGNSNHYTSPALCARGRK